MQKSWEKKWQLSVRSSLANWKPQQVSFQVSSPNDIVYHHATLFIFRLTIIMLSSFQRIIIIIVEVQGRYSKTGFVSMTWFWYKAINVAMRGASGIGNVGQRPHQLAKKKVSQAAEQRDNFWCDEIIFDSVTRIFLGEIWDRNLVFSIGFNFY